VALRSSSMTVVAASCSTRCTDTAGTQLAHHQPEPVGAGGAVVLQDPLGGQGGQQPVHRRLAQAQPPGQLGHPQRPLGGPELLEQPRGVLHRRELGPSRSPPLLTRPHACRAPRSAWSSGGARIGPRVRRGGGHGGGRRGRARGPGGPWARTKPAVWRRPARPTSSWRPGRGPGSSPARGRRWRWALASAGAGVGGVVGGELGAGLDHQVVQVGPDPQDRRTSSGGRPGRSRRQPSTGSTTGSKKRSSQASPSGLPGHLDLLADRGRERLGRADHVQVAGPGGGNGQPRRWSRAAGPGAAGGSSRAWAR
jgi:hypothetical protein